MKPRKTFSIYVLLVGVMGLSIVGGILAFQIFSAATTSQLTAEQTEIIKPIDGTINQTVIDNLEKRTPVSESEIEGLEIVTAISPIASPSSALTLITATESAETTTQ